MQKPSSVDAKIMSAWMDGTNVKTLVNDTLQWPNGLSLDMLAKKLYWCDAYTDRIESYDLITGVRDVSMKLSFHCDSRMWDFFHVISYQSFDIDW